MKKDLDSLMQTNNVDAILATGSGTHNPSVYYFTGGGHLTRVDLIKKRGEDPLLFYQPMERDEAAHTGLKTRNLDDYHYSDLFKKTGGDTLKARVMVYKNMLTDLGITSGKLVIYGKIDAGWAHAVFDSLQAAMPELTIVGEVGSSLLSQAMVTKEQEEIASIRKIGKSTVEVVGRVAEFLTSHRVEADTLVKSDGRPLTIADVKQKINLWLAELDAENPEGTIFSIGRDAGVPHSAGNPADTLQLGKTIVFDIYPCEAGGGYFYDLTRTWCLGYASDEVQKLYADVRTVFDQVRSEFTIGTHCPVYQRRTCELFEAQGHPTVKSTPQTLEGYVHSLGHGVGLNIHEAPWFGDTATPSDLLIPGVVCTVEPGLYYPERGMGMRLEDTVWVRPDGKFETLAEYPYDLVLPVGK
jgi:Xaa-Pro aminopeptidase